MTIEVISRRKGGHRPNTSDGTVVYIGRGTVLGNPFPMANDSDVERARVIDEYRKWINGMLNDKNQMVCDELNKLYRIGKHGKLYLECWCAPKKCHGDIIKHILEEAIKGEI